jgi:hypothetical protein
MKKSAFIAVLMLVFGFIMKPAQVYACSNSTGETEKSCCKKEMPEKQDCCTAHQQNNERRGDGCGKNCKHPLCSCTVLNFVYALPFTAEMNNREFFLPAADKIDSCNEGVLSPGFFTIWLPPKIS